MRTIKVARPILVNRLQHDLDKKLILVSTPAGYGKTSLISEFLTACQIPTAWLSLDAEDNHPRRFWSYFSQALQGALSKAGKTLPNAFIPDDLSEFVIYGLDLINELDRLNQPIILALDDYHNIKSQRIHDDLLYLLNHAPEGFHLIIATRADPPFPLARLRGSSALAEFRMKDLRFSQEEISEFMQKVMNLDLNKSDLRMLENTTEGWVAGLQMAGLSLHGKPKPTEFIRTFSGENRYVMDFLFEEVFSSQPEVIQAFLLRTSILERLCAPLCNAITQKEDAQENLAYLERNNLFLIPLDDERKWYRYHFLFRDLLKNRLKQDSFEDIQKLHQRASVWYEAQGDLEIAISHALAGRDFDQMAFLVEKIARTLDLQNQQTLFTSWLEKLPVDVISNHPWLCVYRAWGAYWTGHRQNDLEPWLLLAEEAIEKFDDLQKQPILGYIATIRAHLGLISKDIPLVLQMSQRALDLLPESDEMRSEAAIALAGAYWAMGDVMQTKKAFGIARDEALKINYQSMAAGTTTFIALQQVKQGLLENAILTLQNGLRLATLPDGSEMPMAGFVNCHLGDIFREQNQLEKAAEYLDRGIAQCRRLGQPDLLCDAYICFARYQLTVGELSEVHAILENADQLARESKVDPWILCWLDDCRIKAWLADNNQEAVDSWLETSNLSINNPFDYQQDLHHQNLARVLVVRQILKNSQPLYQEAEMLLNRLQVAAKLAGWVHEEIKILVLKAINDKSAGFSDNAIQNLLHAVILAQPGNFLCVFLDEGEVLFELFKALDNLPNGVLKNGLEHIKPDTHLPLLTDLKVYISRILSNFYWSSDGKLNNQADRIQNTSGKSALPNSSAERLTGREKEVLYLLAKGYPDKRIAETLVITRETVHKHLKNIYSKLDVHSRTEAVIKAQENKLL